MCSFEGEECEQHIGFVVISFIYLWINMRVSVVVDGHFSIMYTTKHITTRTCFFSNTEKSILYKYIN